MSPVRFEAPVVKFRYGVQVGGRRDRQGSHLPSLVSVELTFGKRDVHPLAFVYERG